MIWRLWVVCLIWARSCLVLLVYFDNAAPLHCLVVRATSSRVLPLLFQHNQTLLLLRIRTIDWIGVNGRRIVAILFLLCPKWVSTLTGCFPFLLALWIRLHRFLDAFPLLRWLIHIFYLNHFFLFVFVSVELFEFVDIRGALLILNSKLGLTLSSGLSLGLFSFQLLNLLLPDLPLLFRYRFPLLLCRLLSVSPSFFSHFKFFTSRLLFFLLVSKHNCWKICTNWGSSAAVSCGLVVDRRWNEWFHLGKIRWWRLLVSFGLDLLGEQETLLDFTIGRRNLSTLIFLLLCLVAARIRLRPFAYPSHISLHLRD